MTIFDSIKYPIHEHSTKEEILALPDIILTIWINHPEYQGIKGIQHPANIILLRKIIATRNNEPI